MDGYSEDISAANKIKNIKELSDYQIKINNEISGLTKDLNSLKNVPENMELWMDQLTDFTKGDVFKLSDFTKMFKLTKQYDKLVEKQEQNASKIKVLVIDTLLDRIKATLKE
jgi:hypothetical protein